MQAALLSFIAVILYAANAVITQKYFHGHPLWTLLISNGLVPIFSIGTIIVVHQSGKSVLIEMSVTNAAAFAVVCGMILFVANLCFYGAYSAGGSVTLVTTIICLLPLISTAMNVAMGGKAPATNEIIGAIIVIVGIVILVYPRTK